MRIALVELGGSHDECLYSQVRILKSRPDVHLTLIAHPDLKDRVNYFEGLDATHFVSIRTGIRGVLDLFRLKEYVIEQGFEKVILNTAQGSLIGRWMRFKFPSNIQFYGTLHNISKLEGSHSQSRIHKKVKSYFVLNEYLLDKARKLAPKGLRFQTYYPIFFPDYPTVALDKGPDEIWITIPGQVEFKRRDYEGLFHSIKHHGIPPRLTFILLGRCEHRHGDGHTVKEWVHELGENAHVKLWDDFIDLETYFSYLKASDYILPLIHPDDVSSEVYAHQITGAFNLAFGFKKTLLMEKSFEGYEDFKDTALFYEVPEMMEQISHLTTKGLRAEYQLPKWSFEEQVKDYWNVILS
jgi:hypothetical protein